MATVASAVLYAVTIKPSDADEPSASRQTQIPDLAVVDAEDRPAYVNFESVVPSRVYKIDKSAADPIDDEDQPVDVGSTPVIRMAPDIDSWATAGRGDDQDDDRDDDRDDDNDVEDSEAEWFLRPGLYATRFNVEDCAYELRRESSSGGMLVIGADRVIGGRAIVTVNAIEPDIFEAEPGCGTWSPWSPLEESLEVASTGDYWIGDLRQGLWSVPRYCHWEKVVSFRGAELADVVESGLGSGTVEIDADTLGVRVRSCPEGMKFITELSE